MLGVKRNKVLLVPHDDAWKDEFQRTQDELIAIFGDNLIKASHVGSTAIKGIVAKPILDVAVVMKSVEQLNLEGMAAAGYEYCEEHGIPGRHLFVRRVGGDLSTHHIHCYLENHDNYRQTILFCNFLNNHADYAKQYSDLKLELASKYPEDRVAYTDAKASFITGVIELARKEQPCKEEDSP